VPEAKHVTKVVITRPVLSLACLLIGSSLMAAERGGRYMLILSEPPLAVAADDAAKQGRKYAEADHRRKTRPTRR